MEHIPHTAHIVTSTALLLLIASGTLAFAKQFKLPFTVLLVLVGMAVSSLVHSFPQQFMMFGNLEISPDMILFVFLPTLIFESTFNMDAHRLRQNLGSVMMLAVPGHLLSTAVIGGIVTLVTDLPLIPALLLGAILSATDPVAVISLFKQLGAPKRLVILVEGESLFNDASSIVLSKILLGVLAAGSLSAQAISNGVLDFIILFLGGVIAGVFLGWISGLLLGLVEADGMIEVSITTAVAYLSYLIAEEFLHVSGVMATVGVGLTLGGWGRLKISPPVRDYLEHFWEYMAFLANAFIFLLVGMKVSLPELWQSLDVLLVVIVAMLLARAATIYGLVPILDRMLGTHPINFRYQTVMFWGGLRGAIALAIVLSLDHFEYTPLFTTLVMGSVLFSLLVQGLSMERLMNKLGLDQPPLVDILARLEYRLSAQQKALELLPHLQHGGCFSGSVAEKIQQQVRKDLANAQLELNTLRQNSFGPDKERALLFLRAIAEERASYGELFERGHISEQTYRHLLLAVSIQVETLRHESNFIRIQKDRLGNTLKPRMQIMLACIPGLSALIHRRRLKHHISAYEINWAHYLVSIQVLERLSELTTLESLSIEVVSQIESNYRELRETARKYLNETARLFPEFFVAMQEQLARRMVLIAAVSTAELHAEHGVLPQQMAEQIQHDLRHQILTLSGPTEASLHAEPEEPTSKLK